MPRVITRTIDIDRDTIRFIITASPAEIVVEMQEVEKEGGATIRRTTLAPEQVQSRLTTAQRTTLLGILRSIVDDIRAERYS